MERKVYYLTIDNLDKNLIGCLGGKYETRFIDIFAKDSFILRKHFCSFAQPEAAFFSMMTGFRKPDPFDAACLTSLMTREFGGVCLAQRKELKSIKKNYISDEFLDFETPPVDLATSLLKYIRSQEYGFVYGRFAAAEKDDSHDKLIKIDNIVGKALAGIEEFGDYDDSYIILTSSGNGPVPCIFKLPESMSKRFYNHSRNINYVSRDIDILPTIFDLEDEYFLLPTGIDGTSLNNNFQGKDQKLTAVSADGVVLS